MCIPPATTPPPPGRSSQGVPPIHSTVMRVAPDTPLTRWLCPRGLPDSPGKPDSAGFTRSPPEVIGTTRGWVVNSGGLVPRSSQAPACSCRIFTTKAGRTRRASRAFGHTSCVRCPKAMRVGCTAARCSQKRLDSTRPRMCTLQKCVTPTKHGIMVRAVQNESLRSSWLIPCTSKAEGCLAILVGRIHVGAVRAEPINQIQFSMRGRTRYNPQPQPLCPLWFPSLRSNKGVESRNRISPSDPKPLPLFIPFLSSW